MNSFYCMRFYVTYRCNSRCGYCNVWQDPAFRGIKELSEAEGMELIRQCHGAGVRFLDFTGGEPTLCPHLPRWITFAKSLGIKTEVTTNAAITSDETLDEIAALVDKCNVSLDTLDPQRYHRIRGIDRHGAVVSALTRIRKLRQAAGLNPPRIVMTLSGENGEDLPEMISFAQKTGVELYLNPMFPFFSGQMAGNQSALAAQIASAVYAPNTVVMLHFVEFCTAQGEDDRPKCSANRQTLTFAPDGSLILPCYHACQTSLPWTGNLEQMLSQPLFRQYQLHQDFCSRCKQCTVTPYFGISFNHRLNRYFLIQSYSEKLNHLKRDYLNYNPQWEIPSAQLLPLLEILRQTAASYPAQESEDQDCWQLEQVPHFGFDWITKEVYAPAFEAFHRQPSQQLTQIFSQAAQFQLRWWIHYLQQHMSCAILMPPEENRSWLEAYLDLLSRECLARDWSQGTRAVNYCKQLL